jgi:hypothetical protein
VTARPRGLYRDPVETLAAIERATCKGCPHERIYEFLGAMQTICAIGMKHGERCEQYGKRQNHMTIDAIPVDDIDAVLTEWYEWSQGFRPVAGYSGADSTCRDFKISNQWMDYDALSEVVDYQLLATTGEAVEPIILALNIQHRVAVMTAVRNFVAGALVFTNPRSPATQDADYAAAKETMRPALFAKGLINRL